MINSETVYIVITPPATLDEKLIKGVADILNKNMYDARLLLTGEIPKIVAHYENMQTAEPVLHTLKELGIETIALNDSVFSQPREMFKAYTLAFGKKEVVFVDRSGTEKRVGDNDAFLIIAGKIQTSIESESIITRKKLNITSTLLTGGIPIHKKVKEKTTTHSQETEYFLRLYSRKPLDSFIAISQHDMDYSFLGEKTAMSTRANFITLISTIQELFPQAIFNDSLSKSFGITSSHSRSWDDIEMHCRLIYAYNLVKNGLDPAI
jgi:hypothetical protein